MSLLPKDELDEGLALAEETKYNGFPLSEFSHEELQAIAAKALRASRMTLQDKAEEQKIKRDSKRE